MLEVTQMQPETVDCPSVVGYHLGGSLYQSSAYARVPGTGFRFHVVGEANGDWDNDSSRTQSVIQKSQSSVVSLVRTLERSHMRRVVPH